MKIMQQYKELKEKHPGRVILFRKNNAYVAYEDDAMACAKALKMSVIVNRRIGSEDYGIKSVSFPHDEFEVNMFKLVRAGHRIEIHDLLPDPNEKKLAKRGVPPTISDDGARK